MHFDSRVADLRLKHTLFEAQINYKSSKHIQN